jgi:DNA-binding FadR family transcriptional regulator
MPREPARPAPPKPSQQPVRRAAPAATVIKNVHGHTVDRLGEAIVAGRYPVGATLPAEPLLCEEFGVSRTVVREAVKSLAA